MFCFYGDIMKKILDFPDGSRQIGEGFCGSNALKHIILYKHGLNVPETSLMNIACGSRKNGISVRGITKIAEKFNLDYNLKCNSSISDVIDSIKGENPALLLIQAWPNKKISDWSNTWEFGHYVVAIGYDKKKDRLNYYDPIDGKKKNLSYKKLVKIWHDKDSENVYHNFGMFFKN